MRDLLFVRKLRNFYDASSIIARVRDREDYGVKFRWNAQRLKLRRLFFIATISSALKWIDARHEIFFVAIVRAHTCTKAKNCSRYSYNVL
jgi:hypothetical protein